MEKNRVQNQILYILFGVLVTLLLVVTYIQDNRIKKLKSIQPTELPYFAMNNATGEIHKYFEYNDVILSTYTNEDKFYGFEWVDYTITFSIECNILKNECVVQKIDKKCMEESNPPNEEGFTNLMLNETGCVVVYSIKGTPEKRVY